MRLVAAVALGRLLIWTLQTSGLTRRFWNLAPVLRELGDCDFCLGAWVYTLFAWALQINFLDPVYVPALSEVATGVALAFAVHLGRIGWQTQFGTLELKG